MNSPFRYLIGPTGGLAYHASALRFRRSLWTPFIDRVDLWLTRDWLPTLNSRRELIIFGPSAGWTLKESFLRNFDRIICVEPDPIARTLFRSRFKSVNVTFDRRADLLPWMSSEKKFADFIDTHPQAAILFSNLLGQVPLLLADKQKTPEKMRAGQSALLKALSGRAWASYHDLVSSTLPVKTHGIRAWPMELNELCDEIFDSEVTGSVTDHETSWLESRAATLWEIRPGTHHVVGFTCAS